MLTIRTDNKYRNLIYGYELSDKERAEFDYISENEIMMHDFIKYKGVIYDPCEFIRCGGNGAGTEWKNWDGYFSCSAWHGVLIKYSADFEQVKIAQYFS